MKLQPQERSNSEWSAEIRVSLDKDSCLQLIPSCRQRLGVGCARPSDENKKKCIDSNSRLLSHCTAWDSGREQAFQQQ